MVKKLVFLCGMLGMDFADILCMTPEPIDGQRHVVFSSPIDPYLFDKSTYSPALFEATVLAVCCSSSGSEKLKQFLPILIRNVEVVAEIANDKGIRIESPGDLLGTNDDSLFDQGDKLLGWVIRNIKAIKSIGGFRSEKVLDKLLKNLNAFMIRGSISCIEKI
jgi:hypothetical protein